MAKPKYKLSDTRNTVSYTHLVDRYEFADEVERVAREGLNPPAAEPAILGTLKVCLLYTSRSCPWRTCPTCPTAPRSTSS